ncbi:tubulin binding cofactor C-domain-containing protein, partial [Cunninghamella echinulata]
MVEPTATQASNNFWVEFKNEKQSIIESIEQSHTISKTQLQEHFNIILQKINQLDKRITKATEYIPSYDERQYALQIRELNSLLDTARKELTPKPKFSFKSKLNKAKAPANTTNNTTLTKGSNSIKKEEEKVHGMENTITFNGISNQVLLLSSQSIINNNNNNNNIDISLSQLEKCVIWLINDSIEISTIHIKDVKNCIIVCGIVKGSVLIYGLENSIITVDCHQFRMHDACNVEVLLNVSSRPIMEDSSRISIGDLVNNKPSNNYFDQMEDFNWLKQQASPNWTLMKNDRKEQLIKSTQRMIGQEQLDSLLSLG